METVIQNSYWYYIDLALLKIDKSHFWPVIILIYATNHIANDTNWTTSGRNAFNQISNGSWESKALVNQGF